LYLYLDCREPNGRSVRGYFYNTVIAFELHDAIRWATFRLLESRNLCNAGVLFTTAQLWRLVDAQHVKGAIPDR